jgi:potassium efflux system protein
MCDAGALDLPDAGRLFYGVLPLCFIVTGYILLNPVKGLFASTIVDQPDSRVAQAPWLPLLIVTGILITVGSLSVAGWYATILLLQRVLILSIMFIAVLMIARELLLRLLTCRQRVQVLALRRQEAEGEDITDQEVNLETLSEQTQGAIGFTVFVLLATGLWFLWSPVLPALQFGDGIVLWSRAIESLVANEDGALVQTTIAQPITLRDVGAAVFTIGFAMYAARHIPYLLGLLLLDRFRVGVGNRYAAVQIVRWAIGFGGLAAGVAMLGVTWDSVQWLAAGFTVGLGFGLQEIFANFISGIIILFEQPVRVGDMVTVGGTTGRITTVRMRSTAITDWDNKVLMVPNKMLITQEVINWSQGETSIRVVLAVGVSYGEDPEKVAAILLDAGRAAPHVLEEPEPTVNFNGFGESSMNFELRVFIPTTDRLVETRTWINTDVKRRFDEAGVTIPFPQRDIRVTMIGGAAIEPAAKRDDGDRTESPPGAEA